MHNKSSIYRDMKPENWMMGEVNIKTYSRIQNNF